MHFDDLIIGSGLSGLGVLLGLAKSGRSVGLLVDRGSVAHHYPETQTPAQHLGHGGLGKYWHGVVPLGLRYRPPGFDESVWERLLEQFYPKAQLRRSAVRDRLFVPKNPIRSGDEVDAAITKTTAARIVGTAIRIDPRAASVVVTLDDGRTIEAGRCWLAAGAIGSAKLLMASELIACRSRAVADHIIGYVGQVPRSSDTDDYFKGFERVSGGVVMPSRFSEDGRFLFTLRPARFDFAQVDAGIAKRAVFGLPARRAVTSVVRSLSPGLVSEALFNKFGLFRSARRYSVYFQSEVAEALKIERDGELVRPNGYSVEPTVLRGIAQSPFHGLNPTRQTKLFIPGIHLHGTLGGAGDPQFGPGSARTSIMVVDAATLRDIGPEHHSFAMMARAFAMAERTI